MSDEVYVVSTKEAAAILQISAQKIYKLVEAGVLKTESDGFRLYILYDSMVDYLKHLEIERFNAQFEKIRNTLLGDVAEQAKKEAKHRHDNELRRLYYHRKQQRRRQETGAGPLGRIPGTFEKHSRKRTRHTGD